MKSPENSRFPDALLASSVNGGGLFVVAEGAIDRISPIDTTGIAITADGFIWARQVAGPAELRRTRSSDVERVVLTEQQFDLHDVLLVGDLLYVVATEINTLFEFDAETYAEKRRWTLAGEPDSQHLNSVCVHEGRILVSRFGGFARHRGYKGQTRGAGQVVDIETGDVVIDGLSQPHSLTSIGEVLWLCDSEAHRVCAFRGVSLVMELQVGGYARGLAFGSSRLYVGISRSRNEAEGSTSAAAIASFDLTDLRPRDRIEFPANEIYDLVVIPDDLSTVRGAGARDTLHEIDALRHARNQLSLALASAHSEHAELLAALQVSRQECALAAGQLAAAAHAATDEAHRASETAAWSDLLRTAVDDMKQGLLERDREIERLRSDARDLREGVQWLEAHRVSSDARMAEITHSRSWRWTRPLRSREGRELGEAAPDGCGYDVSGTLRGQADAARALAARDSVDRAMPAITAPRRSAVPVCGMSFVEHAEPLVSIVVTAYGNFEETRGCLTSIQRSSCAATFEVILIDDCSGDDEMGRFAHVPGLRYVENAENRGYLRSVNHAATLARGRYLHLLNNDTRVTPGWLDALLQTFVLFHDCRLAGSKLVYPDGSLQEAGGIVWSDGDACNYGRGDDPSLEQYSVVREVDYVSGASILLPTQQFIAMGGYDERYLPAYYEDTDLAFRIREEGGKVYVQPQSVVVHHEGVSHGTDVGVGIKASQLSNRAVFLDRWRDALASGQMRPGEHVFLARDRAQLKQIVLIVDRYPPQPDRDAGSRAIWQLMRVLHLQGFTVKFWADEAGSDAAYANALLCHGIEVLDAAHSGGFQEWIRDHGAYVDHVILSRPLVAERYLEAVKQHSAATLTFYGHDIHHWRIARQAAIESNAGLAEQAAQLYEVEHALWREVDLVLYPSDEETAEVREYQAMCHATGEARTVPLFALESVVEIDQAAEAANGTRDSLLFVGGFSHAPNADAVLWFAREVWPIVRASHPSLRLCIAGADPSMDILALASASVEVAGVLSEAELHARYRRARVAIAPLRFGAGTKGKVIEAMWQGVPCVTTSIGQQGLTAAEALSVADDPAAMAQAIGVLIDDDAAWSAASSAGQAFVLEHCSVPAVWGVLSPLFAHRPRAETVAGRRVQLQQISHTVQARSVSHPQSH